MSENKNDQFCEVCDASMVPENFEVPVSQYASLHVVEHKCIVCGNMKHREVS